MLIAVKYRGMLLYRLACAHASMWKPRSTGEWRRFLDADREDCEEPDSPHHDRLKHVQLLERGSKVGASVHAFVYERVD